MKNQKQSAKKSGAPATVTIEKLQERLENSYLADDELSFITGGGGLQCAIDALQGQGQGPGTGGQGQQPDPWGQGQQPG